MLVIVWCLDLQLPMHSVSITSNVVSLNSPHGEVYSILRFVIKFVSDLRQVDDTQVFSTKKTDRPDINDILLKVTLITIALAHPYIYRYEQIMKVRAY